MRQCAGYPTPRVFGTVLEAMSSRHLGTAEPLMTFSYQPLTLFYHSDGVVLLTPVTGRGDRSRLSPSSTADDPASTCTMGCQLRCFLQLVLVACLLGTVRPSPKGEGSQPKRTEGKRSASSLKKKGAPHPTVPRSRLQASAVQQQPGPAAPSRPSLQGARPKAGGSDAAPVKSKPPSADAPAEEGELSMSERAALIGGLMLAPAGIGGFLLGCSIGGGGVLLYEKVSKGVHDALSEFKAKHQTEIEGGFRSFEQYAQLTEITVKAPSEELAAAYKQRLTNVLSQPHNRRCFDCTHCEDEMAAWASINLGIFICERCAGMHRALGTHKSRIKSAYADVWTLEMIEVRPRRAGLRVGWKGCTKVAAATPHSRRFYCAADGTHAS